jgi:hypothetical protein
LQLHRIWVEKLGDDFAKALRLKEESGRWGRILLQSSFNKLRDRVGRVVHERGIVERTRSLELVCVELSPRAAIKASAIRVVLVGDRPRQTLVPAPKEGCHDADLISERAPRPIDQRCCYYVLLQYSLHNLSSSFLVRRLRRYQERVRGKVLRTSRPFPLICELPFPLLNA